MRCPKCHFENPSSFGFCGRCGSPLRANAPSTAAERRQLTVMFCDMVGSTTLSGQLDPEELHEVIGEYQSVCAKIVEHHAGTIAKFLGDGLLVYFGYPLAHEDDAQRAVRAALEIVTAIATSRERLGRPLQVRIAIHTGLVVVGQLGGETNPDPMEISGDTPNIADRLQRIAEPGSVVISDATYRLVEGFFRCRNLGTPALRGIASPVQAYSVLEQTGIQTRFEKAVAIGLTPFVNREKELELLLERWQQAVAGSGQVVQLKGDAGIGKSRLIQVLKDWTTNQSINELECRCSPYYQNSANLPAITLLQRVLRFNREDDAEIKLSKLEAGLKEYGFSLPTTVPLFAVLMSLPAGERYPAPAMASEPQRQKTLETIVEWLLRAAERGPTRLIVEDLHWADPSTIELIELLIERVADARIFIALLARPEFVSPWPALSYVTSLTLERLPRSSTEQMLQSVARGKQLPSEMISQIVVKTEGVPLFVEELTRMVLESDLLREEGDRYVLTKPRPMLTIPSTLNDSLMVRLDRLGDAKQVAQMGATVGREFSYELLRAISPLYDSELTWALNRLIQAELLELKLSQSQPRYGFRHALIRDAAYQSLLRSQRRLYHRKIAEVLQERFAETVEASPELLANHFTEAGLVDQALPYWQRAGQRALERSAIKEAIRLFATALELLKKLPETPARDSQELELYMGYLPALNVSREWSTTETGAAYQRARELCEHLGETSRMFRVLRGQAVFYQGRGEQQRAYDIAVQAHDLARRNDGAELRLGAGWLLGVSLYYLGNLVAAHEHLVEALHLTEESSRSHGRQNPRIDCLSVDAEVMWMLGYADQSKKISAKAVALARTLGRPFDLALALTHAHMLTWFRRDYEQAIALADEGIEFCASKNFGFLETALAWSRDMNRIFMGAQHDIDVARRAFAAYHEAGTKLHLPPNYTFLAQSFGILGRPGLGLESINAAIAATETTRQRTWESETWRVKGDLILQQLALQPATAIARRTAELEAETYFRKAIETASRQHAKLFELRGAMSLARLLRHSSRTQEGRSLLSDVYNWFTEGFDTADLTQSRALLEELSSASQPRSSQ